MAEIVRAILIHHGDDANSQISITADPRDPDNGMTSHVYTMTCDDRKIDDPAAFQVIKFQRGALNEPHETGITHEALLAILIDRLQGFQSSKWACQENALALTKLQEALMWLQARTHDREMRGVEGTHEV